MTDRLAKLIFWVGTASSAVLFLALTWNTHQQFHALTHADQLSEQVVQGKHAFQKHNCNDCHTILGFGGYYAPDLTRVIDRRGEVFVRRALAKPEVVFANSVRKMPQQNLTGQEIDDMVAFFSWVGAIENGDWPPQDSRVRRNNDVRRLLASSELSVGAASFKAQGCFQCHRLQGAGSGEGPALDDVGSRMSPALIKKIIVDPQSVYPDATMPGYPDIPAAEVDSLAAFLAMQTGGAI